MRVAVNKVLVPGQVDIDDVELDPKSRDDFPAVLQGTQSIHRDANLLEKILDLLCSHLFQDSASEGNGEGSREDGHKINPHVGRPGMTLWAILVLAIVKQALNCDCDRLVAVARRLPDGPRPDPDVPAKASGSSLRL